MSRSDPLLAAQSVSSTPSYSVCQSVPLLAHLSSPLLSKSLSKSLMLGGRAELFLVAERRATAAVEVAAGLLCACCLARRAWRQLAFATSKFERPSRVSSTCARARGGSLHARMHGAVPRSRSNGHCRACIFRRSSHGSNGGGENEE